MGISNNSLAFISKILNILCAVALITMAILRYGYDGSSLSVLDAIWTFYWIKKPKFQRVFGIFILLAEFKVSFFLRYLNFLSAYIGKGIFITFCGTLLIDQWSWKTAIGIVLIVNGIICILLGFRLKDGGESSTSANEIKEPIQDLSSSKV